MTIYRKPQQILRQLATAILAFSLTFAFAGPPDIVEDFTNFDGVSGADTTSPTDTSSLWGVLGGGQPSTPAGFEVDPLGYHGQGVTWSGAETKALIQSANFTGTGPNPHQLAFTVKYSAPTQPLGTADFVQVVGPVPIDFNILNLAIVNYVIGVGHTETSENAILVFVPTSILGTFQTFAIPAEPDVWHRVVVQYQPASTLLALNATIKVWVDPTDGSDPPDLDVASGLLGSFFGLGRIGRFAVGNSTPSIHPRPAETPADGKESVAPRVGSSRTKADTIVGWYGTAETRAGSLGDAIAYFDSLGAASSVGNWTDY